MVSVAMASSPFEGRKRHMRPWEKENRAKRVVQVGALGLILSTSQGLLIAKNVPRLQRTRYPACCDVTTSTLDSAATESALFEHPVGLYVHIPYCRRRCRYCDFAIIPIGPSAVTEHYLENDKVDRATRGFLDMDATYRSAIIKELGSIVTLYNNTSIPLRSIYFGGGTPSLAPLETVESILSTVFAEDSPFVLERDAEISMEMDPGTFSLSKLQSLRDMGFNRVSLGIQSFDDSVLESIGRCHRRADIFQSISLLQQVYGDNVNYSIDLISGLPGVTLATWAETLQTATNLFPKPKHLSLYDLQIETGTVFAKWYENEESPLDKRIRGSTPVSVAQLPSPGDCAFAYKYASAYLRAKGYEHYEISSYAFIEGSKGPSCYRSRHNQIYWEPNGQWFAVGLGATSSINGKRYARPRALTDYISWVDGKGPYEALTPEPHGSLSYDCDLLTDIIMTRLRTSEGLDLDWIKENVPGGEAVVEKVMAGAKLGLDLGLATHTRQPESKTAGTLRLVDPDGFLFSNSIISSIFVELDVDD